MSHEPPESARIAPERWYGERLGHLSRHDRTTLLRDELRALCATARQQLNVFAIRKSFLNAGGKEEHWVRISECLSALHSLAPPIPDQPAAPPPSGPEEGAEQPTVGPSLQVREAGGSRAQRDAETRPSDNCYSQLGQVLVQRGAITQAQLEHALQRQLRTGERLGSILVATGTVDPHQVAQALAAQTGLLAVDLDLYPVQPQAVELLPLELCEQHCMLPVKASGDVVLLAMGNPADADAYTASRQALPDRRIRRVVAAEIQIEKRLQERKSSVRSRR